MLFADMIIKGRYVLTMNTKPIVVENGAVAIVGSMIKAVGKESEVSARYQAKRIINTGNSIVMPGFINTHTHAGMTYFRGIAEDVPLDEWLNKYIWPTEAKYVNKSFIEKSTELACLEMIRAGVTTFNDMYFFADKVAEVALRAGMRAVVGEPILDFPTPAAKTPADAIEMALKCAEEYKNNKLIKVSLAPHSVYACSRELLVKVKGISEEKDLLIHTHLCETQKEVDEMMTKHKVTPVEYLDVLGLFTRKMTAAHMVWVNDEDIKILKKNNIGIAHCPVSNMKLASGIARIAEISSKGIKIGLATDSVASNNTLEMFSEMKIAALLQKSSNADSTVIKAKDVVAMATGRAAEVIGLGDEIGSLKIGKKADIITIGLNKPHLAPIRDPYAALVYAAMPSDVDNVIIDGKLVMSNREMMTLDEEKILDEAEGNKY